ncbi:DUF882 domain-containing protein [Bradyrhizobium sp.]|uniref:DUF882 domain-containing protein n=1 Tax=Bradyrhizobium sp. TaxID=376 RepID=UPI0040377A9D
MLAVFARQFKPLCSPNSGYRAGLAAVLLLAGAGAVRDATALNETRTLSFHHTHSGEDLTVTFKRNGRYDEEALKQLNHFLRDWRNQEKTEMDRRLFDILWEVYRDVDGKQPINIISSYRSPATNAMLRRRSSGVARHSQHMLGHAIDFFIPGVALEQIRYAGLRQQRGGVGFYPTSGSPFVHLDTGSVRHWPRMTFAQLSKVFPDGRTVHQSTSGPMKGYELARAELERRGNGEETQVASKATNFLAALFKGKSAASDEDDEASVPAPAAKVEQPVKTKVVAAAPAKAEKHAEKPAKPAASTLQLASADAKIVPAPKPAPAASAAVEAKPQGSAAPQTPADIINARGFWDNIPAPQQASPAQIAALNARKAVNSADPQPTASVSDNFNRAMAYAPAAASPVDRANIVAASAPIPRSTRPAAPSRYSMAVNDVTTVVAKSGIGHGGMVATSARLAASRGNNEIWLRVMMLAPSASTSMSVTVFGDADLTLMRQHFIKPQAIVAMTFSDDPALGLVTDRFTGSATARLETMSFVMRTAALR